MFISKKIAKYFAENKDKTKEEVIKELMELGYKESTARAYYSNRNQNVINLKKIAFKFFDKNPSALDDMDNKKYCKKLGISISTYANYKSQYKAEKQKENQKLIKAKREKAQETKEPPKYGEKYYKGRLRETFTFDDSKLFG